MTYERPGQPTVRRNDGIGFIPIWEKVLTPVIDELMNHEGCFVDEDRLVLAGVSTGGSLTARAAAFEPRIKALILNGGVWAVYEGYTGQLTPDLKEILAVGKQEEFDEAALPLLDSPQVPTAVRWGLGHGLWCFKQYSPYLRLESLKEYTLMDVEKLNVPVLVVDPEVLRWPPGGCQGRTRQLISSSVEQLDITSKLKLGSSGIGTSLPG